MNAHPREDWWTPQQQELVDDRSRNWQLLTFESSDAVSFQREETVVSQQASLSIEPLPSGHVIRGGWDHEHCALCWQTISRHPGHQASGYSDGSKWLCCECYERYVVPRL